MLSVHAHVNAVQLFNPQSIFVVMHLITNRLIWDLWWIVIFLILRAMRMANTEAAFPFHVFSVALMLCKYSVLPHLFCISGENMCAFGQTATIITVQESLGRTLLAQGY